MLPFLLYTVIAILANACLAKILYISIQPGQWLDKLLGWQRRLQQWDIQGKTFLVKAGGYCELCFSHFISFVSFWCYVLFAAQVLHTWLTAGIDNIAIAIAINIIWYLVYISLATNLALIFITNPLRRNNNNP
jgi:hypothetical protein